MKFTLALRILLASLVLMLGSCRERVGLNAADGRLRVVATFSVLADFAAQVGGDRISLRVLVPSGGDAHEFDPSPSDAARLVDADVIIENGLGFDSWLNPLYAASRSHARRAVASDGIAARVVGDHGERDPHVWQDVDHAIAMVENIARALSDADPAYSAEYAANALRYTGQLRQLDADIAADLSAVSVERRRIVTAHDSLGYFAARYDIDIVGRVIDSLSTESGEPSAQEIALLVDAIRAQRVRAIFPESMSNPRLVERVAQEAGVRVGGELFTDALGESGSGRASYIEAMRWNVRAIVEAVK